MAAALTGTPVVVTWAAGINPAAQNISIPSDATAVYMFWTFWTHISGTGFASATLNGTSPSATHELDTNEGSSAIGVAVWYSPPTGTRSLDVSWDAAPSEGPTCVVAFVKDGDTSAWRDADSNHNVEASAVSVTLTTVAGDLVIKYDQRYDGSTPPALSTGWTNGQTTINNSESARLSYISATGTTQVCDSESENFSTVCAISIPAGAATATSLVVGTRTAMQSLLAR